MRFQEFRILNEATKELYAAIGKAPTDALLKTKVDPVISKMHDHVFGVGNHHIEMPLDNDLPEKVKSHIEANGDKVEGDGVKLKTGRVVPISKYLPKSGAPKDVQDEHQNWVKNKAGNSKLVITRHPAEVASASTGTHWDSCARASKKNSREAVPAWDAMPRELHNGTMMAMHVHKDATPDKSGNYASKDILGRTLIKRHDADIDSENPTEVTFHRENKKYGAFPESAKKAVDEFTAKHYPQKTLTAHKVHTLYDDDNQPVKVNHNHAAIEHAFTQGHDKEQSQSVQDIILNHGNVTHATMDRAATSRYSKIRADVGNKTNSPETIRKVFQHKAENTVNDIQAKVSAVKNPHAPKDVVDDAIKHEDATIREGAYKNLNLSADQISTGLKDRNSWVQSSVARHPNLSKEHVDSIINNDGKQHADGRNVNLGTSMHSAVRSIHASHDQIMSGIHNKDPHVAMAALENPKIDKTHLLHALDSTDSNIHSDAIHHDAVDHDVLHKALLHKDIYVRRAAIKHSKATKEHITKALTDTDSGVRINAISKPNATKEHIDKALTDENADVRMNAINQHNATKEHINKVLNDEDSTVRYIAKERLKDFK